ncbi:MAG: hypothetical protein IT452_16405 [Planctomycetia bacterium]|nr:hypothetical protein [Planctomycetia bacterium]
MSTQGQLVAETFDFDGGRQVTAWVLAAPPRAVVYAGDGQLIPQWGDFALAAGAPPTMIVGVHRLDDETGRLHEDTPYFASPRFDAHAARWADAFKAAGADVVMTERPGTHGDDFWRTELPLRLRWAFGTSP